MTEYKVIDTATFYVEEGWYTIAEMEDILANVRAIKKHQDEMLRRSMQEVK